MKDSIFIIIFSLFIYLGFATIFGDTGLMGRYGSTFALYNHLYFGYLSYVYILALLYPLYLVYKHTQFNFRKLELSVAIFLSFYSLLLIQAMLIQNGFRGEFAGTFVDFLSPYIGIFGLSIFLFIITSLSIIMILDKSSQEIFSAIVKFLHSIKEEKSISQVIPEEERYIQIQEIKENIAVPQLEIQKIIENENIPQEIDEIKTLEKLSIENEIDMDTSKEDFEVKNKKVKKQDNLLDLAKNVKEQKNAIVVEELEENAKLLEKIEKGEVEKPKNFQLPPIDFLQKQGAKSQVVNENELDDKIRYLIEKLAHFKIEGDVVRTYTGPVVSTFEFKPAANVKVSKILNLQDDLAMALSAETIRIQAPIPGKDVVGIEIPNETVDTIYLRELLDSNLFKDSSSPLTIALGKDIVGKPFVTDLKKLPHLLIAGTTGSGKSVGINAMILSLLYKNSPDQLRLLMIDPKMLEFTTYNDIPHLLTPVITKPKQAIVALNNMVLEMERRYELMAATRTKNIENYNEKIIKEGGEHFPYIVVIIDELADLMMTSGKDVEISIARLAQKSRACGIHLIVATQRPSVDVVTGLIKANLPSRISYRVGQKIDSKIILDQMGAESLLGRGDMLFTPPGSPALVRLHAPWATEDEIENIVEFIKSQREPNYDKSFLVEESENINSSTRDAFEELDALYEEAKTVVLTDRKTSISYLQRKLQIGYNRSARIIEQLESKGILSCVNAKGIREII